MEEYIMGWTFTHKPELTSTKEFLEQEFNCTNGHGHGTWKVLECKIVGSVAYLAISFKNPTEDKVFACVCLTKRNSKSYENFGYKDMDESMGPYYYDCPRSILDKLTPTTNASSNEWRLMCYDKLANKKNSKLKLGDTIVFETNVDFGRYGRSRTFTKVHPTKNHFSSPDINCVVRLTKNYMKTLPTKGELT
jgi:hypothetical protein